MKLAEVVDPAEVLVAIATALSAPALEQRVTARELVLALIGRQVLLVPDNLEWARMRSGRHRKQSMHERQGWRCRSLQAA